LRFNAKSKTASREKDGSATTGDAVEGGEAVNPAIGHDRTAQNKTAAVE
jgi:hypothetical protein